ncbi:hypothetical protein RYX36_009590 [Vicia faba]
MDVKELLPRGLINSGNLCFLSATVHDLLVCSPFVQLLQELRTCNIPKTRLIAGYLVSKLLLADPSKANILIIVELEYCR